MRTYLACAVAMAFTCAARAQFGRAVGDWMADGGDAQRSSWIRADGKISKESLQKPGFQFLWKIKIDSRAKESLAPPLLLNSYIGYRGFRSLAFIGLTSDRVVGVDTDLARVEWLKQPPSSPADGPCAATVALTRPTTAAFPSPGAGRGFGGRGGPAHSGVGEPDAGAVTLKQSPMAPLAFGPPPAIPTAPGVPGAPAARPAPNAFPPGFGRALVMHAITRDGKLHTLYVSNGEPSQPPIQFFPADATVQGLIAIDGVAYAAVGRCGGAPNAMLALDLTSKEVTTFKLDGAIAGSYGASLGPDGTLYVATTLGELVALEPKTLKVKNTYKAGEAFTSSPVVFEYKDKVLIAAATTAGSIHLLDSATLMPLSKSNAGKPVGAGLESWQDLAGTRWLLSATASALVAWKLVEQNGAPSVEFGWTSRDLESPLSPIIINGVAFTASTGSKPVLYALDASTGKDLWHNNQIASVVHGGGLSVGNSQVYLGTNDGTLYAFGFPMEH